MLTEPQYKALFSISKFRPGYAMAGQYDGRVLRALRDLGYVTQFPTDPGYRISANGSRYLSIHGESHESKAVRRPRRTAVSKYVAPDLSQEIRTIVHAVWIDKWVHKTLKQMEFELCDFHDQNRPPEARRTAKDSYIARADVLLDYFRQKTDILTTQGIKKFLARWIPV